MFLLHVIKFLVSDQKAELSCRVQNKELFSKQSLKLKAFVDL